MNKDIFLEPHEAELRIHGNGFLQAETTVGKMHVWDPRLPRQDVATPIHNHNHGFVSEIAHGGVHMLEFNLAPAIPRDEIYIPHQAIPREGKDTMLEPVGQPVRLVNRRSFLLQEGSKYTFPLNMEIFHDVAPQWSSELMVITLVERMAGVDTLPTVLVPSHQTPDNHFNRYGYPGIAEEVYKDALQVLGIWKLN